jgi:hypothetical protein
MVSATMYAGRWRTSLYVRATYNPTVLMAPSVVLQKNVARARRAVLAVTV